MGLKPFDFCVGQETLVKLIGAPLGIALRYNVFGENCHDENWEYPPAGDVTWQISLDRIGFAIEMLVIDDLAKGLCSCASDRRAFGDGGALAGEAARIWPSHLFARAGRRTDRHRRASALGVGMPNGYWIARVTVTTPQSYSVYAEGASAAFSAFGERVLARAWAVAALEGDAPPRNVVIELPSVKQAVACFRSDLYQDACRHREQAGLAQIMIVVGAE